MLKKNLIKIMAMACLISAIVFMALPYAYVMVWTQAPNVTTTSTCSYFDFTSYAYGHFFPPITAILTSISVVCLFIYIFWGKFRLGVLILTLTAAICSVLTLVMCFNITAIGIVAMILLATSCILQIINYRHNKKIQNT